MLLGILCGGNGVCVFPLRPPACPSCKRLCSWRWQAGGRHTLRRPPASTLFGKLLFPIFPSTNTSPSSHPPLLSWVCPVLLGTCGCVISLFISLSFSTFSFIFFYLSSHTVILPYPSPLPPSPRPPPCMTLPCGDPSERLLPSGWWDLLHQIAVSSL